MAVILMYHAISRARGTSADARYTCTPASFARHLVLLRALGRRLVRLDEIVACLRERRPPPARAVAITIDDGFRDAREEALPRLLAHRAPATVFVATGYVGGRNEWMVREGFAARAMLRRADVVRLHRAGIDVGGHSCTHPRLTELDEAAARAEIRACRDALHEMLGVPVRHFAYPYGAAGERERALVREAGFASACGITPLRNDATTSVFDLRRIEVRGTDSLARFAREVLCAAGPPRGPDGAGTWT